MKFTNLRNVILTIMKYFKTPIVFIALFFSSSIHAITFDTQELKINNATDYVEFVGQNTEISDAFEKIVADFNGDGNDDILSLGGYLPCVICGVPPPQPPNFAELLLFDNGEFEFHDMGIGFEAPYAKIVDIDLDNDLDIVMRNGRIAINDGQAHFTLLQIFESELYANDFFVFDWDNDGDLDYVESNFVYLNNGSMNFNKIQNTFATDKDFFILDLNGNGVTDMLVLDGQHLQSWINDGAGHYSHNISIAIDPDFSLINIFDINSDGAQDVLLNYESSDSLNLKLLTNDSTGSFSLSYFNLSAISNINYNFISLTKIINKDMDADGDLDLLLNVIFVDHDANCSNNQNLLVIYENTNNGLLEHKRTLHSIGYKSFHEPESTTITSTFPTIIDLNQDNTPDVVMTGDKPVVWIQRSSYSQYYYFYPSKATSLQFNNHIQALDFNNDGNMDILNSGIYDQQCMSVPEPYPYPDYLTSISHVAHGKLWLGDGNGGFKTYSAPYAGAPSMSGTFEYAKMVDLEQDGIDYLIYTAPAYGPLPRRTRFQHSMLTDPPLFITLPEPTLLVEIADMNNDEQKEIVMLSDTETAEIIVLNRDSFSSFVELARIDYGFRDAEIKLADMDGDGNIDIIANSKSNTSSITIFYNDGTGQFAASDPFANDVQSIAIADFNKDGKLDVFSANEDHEMWLNRGDGNFESINYDTSFWFEAPNNSNGLYTNVIPEKMRVKDINNDGRIDLVVHVNDNVLVYMNNSNNNISFYRSHSILDFDEYNINKLKQSNVAFADFNNDGLMDFANASNSFIKLNLQKKENISSGLYYSADYNGHGFTVEEIGRDNLYYSIFYTYDDDGKPNWYSALNRYRSNEDYWSINRINGNENIHNFYDYDTSSIFLDSSIENLGWLRFYNNQGGEELTRSFYRIGEVQRSWNIQQLINNSQAPENDLSGLWWAGYDDLGWGVSLSFIQGETDQTVVALVYFYDEAGYPRWLIGQVSGFELNQDINLEMKQINGYGRLQNYVELEEIPAGNLSLNLQQASQDLDQAGHLSMDIFYPGDQSDNDYWVRNNVPIALFSKPRD